MDSQVWQYLEKKEFQSGESLFQEGDQTSFFYIIESGRVEVFTKNSQGEKVSLATLSDGEPIGEFAMITQKPRSASATALEPTTAYRVSEAGYKKLLEELPVWAQMMIQNLIERLADSTKSLKQL